MGVEPSIIEAAIMLWYGTNSNLSASRHLEKIVHIPIVVPPVRTEGGLELISSAAGDSILARRRVFSLLIRAGMDRNPRRIKRFTNAFQVALSVAPEPSADEQLTLAKVIIVQMRFPDFYRELTRYPGLMEKLWEVGDETARVNAGVGQLRKDVELRLFYAALEISRSL